MHLNGGGGNLMSFKGKMLGVLFLKRNGPN